MSKHYLVPLIIVAVLLLSVSCSQNPTVVIGDRGLLFAYIDMSSVKGSIQSVVFKSKTNKRTRIRAYYAEGLVYSLNVPPGDYYLAEFSGSGGLHKIGEDIVKPTSLAVSELAYAGSYKYVRNKDKGLIASGEFSLIPISRPGEVELLERLQQRFGDTAWGLKVKQRIRTMGRRSS